MFSMSGKARAVVIFGPLKVLSQIGQRIGCQWQWKRLVNAGGDGYRNMNPKLVYTREKKQYELKIGKLVLIGIRLHTSLEA